MDTAITLTVTPKGILLGILAILLMVLIIFLIVLLAKVIGTLKKVDGILDDTKQITVTAAKWTDMADGKVGEVGDAIGICAEAIKGNQNIAKAASSLVNTATSAISLVKKFTGDDKDDEEDK